MSPHNDFLSFMAVAQYYDIDFLSVSWEQGRGHAGEGGTSQIMQSNTDKGRDFAFKRMKVNKHDERHTKEREEAFNQLVAEISVLRHPAIQYHQNIVNLEGIGWEISPSGDVVWPVLILEKSQLGDLESFMMTERGQATTLQDRLELCADIASGLIALHVNGSLWLHLFQKHRS